MVTVIVVQGHLNGLSGTNDNLTCRQYCVDLEASFFHPYPIYLSGFLCGMFPEGESWCVQL
jgi:hypothetical protein